jgi:purine-binding chemotaxis protein CheW
MADIKQFCTFYLDRRMFGVEVLKVQEVIQCHETTEVPLAHPVIRGLMNLRGSIVSSVDLRRRFQLDARQGDPGVDLETASVVTQTGSGLVALEVDRIGDVVEATEASYEPPPATLSGDMRRMIEGVYKLEGELLLILNVERVMELEGMAV